MRAEIHASLDATNRALESLRDLITKARDAGSLAPLPPEADVAELTQRLNDVTDTLNELGQVELPDVPGSDDELEPVVDAIAEELGRLDGEIRRLQGNVPYPGGEPDAEGVPMEARRIEAQLTVNNADGTYDFVQVVRTAGAWVTSVDGVTGTAEEMNLNAHIAVPCYVELKSVLASDGGGAWSFAFRAGVIHIDGICYLDPQTPDTPSGDVGNPHTWTVIPDAASANGTSQIPDADGTKEVLLHFERYAPAGSQLNLGVMLNGFCQMIRGNPLADYPLDGVVRITIQTQNVLDDFDFADDASVGPPNNTYNNPPTYGDDHAVEFFRNGRVTEVDQELSVGTGSYAGWPVLPFASWPGMIVPVEGWGVKVGVSNWSVLSGVLFVKAGCAATLVAGGPSVVTL